MLKPSIIDEIKMNLLFILDEVVKSRQYLNKHFQNSMNNYFLENYATLPCLKRRYDTQSGRQVRKEIYEKYTSLHAAMVTPQDTLKCFLIMRGFVEEHRLNDSLEIYRETLAAIASAASSSSFQRGSAEWVSHQWRRVFALMVLHHTYYTNIQGVYELWFHVFDERLIARERQKKRKEEAVIKTEPAPYLKFIRTKSEEEDFLTSFHSASSLDQQKPAFQIEEKQIIANIIHQDLVKCQEIDMQEPVLVKKRDTSSTILIIKDHNNTTNNIQNPSEVPHSINLQYSIKNESSSSLTQNLVPYPQMAAFSAEPENKLTPGETISVPVYPSEKCMTGGSQQYYNEQNQQQDYSQNSMQSFTQPQAQYISAQPSEYAFEDSYLPQQPQTQFSQTISDSHHNKEAEELLHYSNRQNSYFNPIQSQQQHQIQNQHQLQQQQHHHTQISYLVNQPQQQGYPSNHQYQQQFYHHQAQQQMPKTQQQAFMIQFYPSTNQYQEQTSIDEPFEGMRHQYSNVQEPLFQKPRTTSFERFSEITYSRQQGSYNSAPLFSLASRSIYNTAYFYSDQQQDQYQELKYEDF